MLKIHMNTGGMAATNAYLVADEATRIAAIIDAPESTTASLISVARHEQYDVQYLLLTHGHWDHLSDHAVVTEAFPKARLLMHRLDEPKLQKPGSEIFDLDYEIPPRNADGYIEDGDKIHIGHLVLAAMHTPGHAPGHLVLYAAEQGVLFSGDLLMAGGVGRYDLSDGNESVLRASLRRIMLLPDAVKVYSGHGPATTIGRERAGNPYLREHGLGQRG
jgi:glyoxylase-like metal-dependent hydrolase (beta-lactamase superfamily II)